MGDQGNIEYHAVECAYVLKFGFGEKGNGVEPNIKRIRKKVNYIFTLWNSKYMSRNACIDQSSMKKYQ